MSKIRKTRVNVRLHGGPYADKDVECAHGGDKLRISGWQGRFTANGGVPRLGFADYRLEPDETGQMHGYYVTKEEEEKQV